MDIGWSLFKSTKLRPTLDEWGIVTLERQELWINKTTGEQKVESTRNVITFTIEEDDYPDYKEIEEWNVTNICPQCGVVLEPIMHYVCYQSNCPCFYNISCHTN